jgi:predicted metal-binding protein
MSIEEFRKVMVEYSSALLLVDEHDTSEVSDILEAWSGIRKDSFHKMLEIELEPTFCRCTQKCYLFSQYGSSLKINLPFEG